MAAKDKPLCTGDCDSSEENGESWVLVERPLPAPASDFLMPPDLLYYNVATLGPAPRRVLEAAHRDVLDVQANPHVNYFGASYGSACERMDNVRGQVAELLDCVTDEVFLFGSTTHALNTVTEGLAGSGFVQAGDRVVTTNQEHAGGLAGWNNLVRTCGLLLSAVGLPVPDTRDEDQVVEDFRKELEKEPRPKVLAISHVLTTTGYTLPIAKLARLARSLGVATVVDGAQALGIPVRIPALDVDIYAAPGHKWLLAPTSVAFCCIRKSFQSILQAPAFQGGPQAYSATSGTRSVFTTLGLGHSLRYLHGFGPSRIHAHAVSLARKAWDHLKAAGFGMLAPRPAHGAGPIVSFAIGNSSQASAEVLLQRHKVVVKPTGRDAFPEEWPAGSPRNALRLTFHVFNSEEQLLRLILAIVQHCIPTTACSQRPAGAANRRSQERDMPSATGRG
mmetsp:Transcript_6490/g.18123  ORF Transcript_6490/g.18123 Transcript_6490/m.18123 type:complete len:448 (-) Transcript_6490:189-1532(-)